MFGFFYGHTGSENKYLNLHFFYISNIRLIKKNISIISLYKYTILALITPENQVKHDDYNVLAINQAENSMNIKLKKCLKIPEKVIRDRK